MTKINNKFATVSAILVAAVASAATFDIPYPAGYSQLSFGKGLAKTSGNVLIVGGNDRYTSGFTVAFGASVITVTNSTGVTFPAGASVDLTLDVVEGKVRIPLTIPLAPLSGITAADVVTEMYPGIDGTIEYWEFVNTVAVTTAAKLATLNLEINTTDVTGSLALTSAALTPKGAVVGAVCTANNVLTRESKLSIEASSVTAFVEGEGFLVIYVRPAADDVY